MAFRRAFSLFEALPLVIDPEAQPSFKVMSAGKPEAYRKECGRAAEYRRAFLFQRHIAVACNHSPDLVALFRAPLEVTQYSRNII